MKTILQSLSNAKLPMPHKYENIIFLERGLSPARSERVALDREVFSSIPSKAGSFKFGDQCSLVAFVPPVWSSVVCSNWVSSVSAPVWALYSLLVSVMASASLHGQYIGCNNICNRSYGLPSCTKKRSSSSHPRFLCNSSFNNLLLSSFFRPLLVPPLPPRDEQRRYPRQQAVADHPSTS